MLVPAHSVKTHFPGDSPRRNEQIPTSPTKPLFEQYTTVGRTEIGESSKFCHQPVQFHSNQ